MTVPSRLKIFSLSALVLAVLAPAFATAAPLRTLWVDKSSRGGPCSDSYTAAENAASNGTKPWCNLGIAGRNAIAGDQITVRAATYSDPMVCIGTPGCSGWAVLELVKKGTQAKPIVYKAYPGETPIIDPAGKEPGVNSGLIYGVLAGSSYPSGLCTGGTRKDLDCTSGAECPGSGGGTCDKSMSLWTTIDGFKFQNWSYYDKSPTATNNNHRTSQYALVIRAAAGTPTDITVRNCEFVNNHGAGALHAYSSGRVTLEYNKIHDNHTHGWGSPFDLWNGRGKAEGPNIIRGNIVYNNEDDPPIFCVPKYCGGSQSLTNRCSYDQYTNTTPVVPQGFGCTCNANDHCQSGQCITRDCSSGTGGCECIGDTEGHGIMFDMNLAAGAAIVENNVVYNNEGACISLFKSDNVVVRNNTCWKNNIRPGSAEMNAFTNGSSFHNNIFVARPGRDAFALYYNTFVYSVDPNSNSEGSNVFFAPDKQNAISWGFGKRGTISEYQADTASLGYGANSVFTDPSVVDGDGAARDYRLKSGSPALGSADRNRIAPLDITGATRTTYDRGAYAAGTGGGLSAPQLLSVDPVP